MQNALVMDCEGVLLDSENGPEEGQYDHNEDYTFTICVPNAREIVLSFDFFATEENYDILTIYDGPDKNSPVIASYSGIIQPPPVVVANSGCITIHFVSDDNIVAIGWRARWSVTVEEPSSPLLSLDTAAVCPMASTVFVFDRPIDCENFDPANFSLIGPGSGSITRIEALDCDPVTGLATRFRMYFSPELQTPGNYRVLFNGSVQDACGDWHDISANALFSLSNCPIEVEIELVEAACAGDCGTIRANIVGSSSPVYDYEWSHTSENSQEVEVCTEDSLLVSVTVIDPVSGERTTASYMYRANRIPEILNPIDGDTICSSNGDHFYQTSIPGGEFFSRIIPDGERRSGRYQFWRWNNSNGLNEDIVLYRAPNGCEVRDSFFTLPINAGSIEAACLGSGSFMVNGGTPVGGSWSGSHISPTGMFDPVEEGRFYVRYTAPNGCSRTKEINVGNGISLPDVDTVCSSRRIELIDVSPYGGRWSGPGIVNSVRGTLEAWRPQPNATYQYVYEMNGCSDTLDIFIQEISAGPDRRVCDADSLLDVNIQGEWSGPANYVDSLSAFDISGLGNGKYNFRVTVNGCSDNFELEIITPELRIEDELFYCPYDEWFNLEDRLDLYPGNGSIAGPTVKDSADRWWVNPLHMGPGSHQLVFEALGCYDTVSLIVDSFAKIPPYEFCELSTATQLQASPAGGVWSGPGFLDEQIGLFDPQLLSVGEHYISYQAPNGCVTNDTIEIFLFEQVEIEGIGQQYCFNDSLISVQLTPPGGSFYINGVERSAMFNPIQYGEGNHELYYTKGVGVCASSRRKFVTVLPPISGRIEASNDSICVGESTVVSIDPEGGAGIISAVWDRGLGFGTSHIVNPDETTRYYVSLDDGCSETFRDSVQVYVHPIFSVDESVGPEVCFEDKTWVELSPPNRQEYSVEWLTDPVYSGFRFEGQPGIYSVLVTELFSGCAQEYDVILPGEAPLRANFSIIPNRPCIDIIDNEIQLIDLSVGYTDGYIDYGDGSPTESLVFGALRHEYVNPGEYTITMVVHNDLGCMDTLTAKLCVENKVRFFVPNAFTPNGDDKNDEFKVQLVGARNVRWSVFDRTGGLIFEALSENDSWDGSYNGKMLNPNVFVVKLSFEDQVTGASEVHYKTVTLIR